MNLGFAKEHAQNVDDVCALSGRIVKTKDGVRYCGHVEFGASKHVASIILSAMAKHPSLRSAMNLRFSKETLHACKLAHLSLSSFDRQQEPEQAVSTMEWGTTMALQQTKIIPDVIYDFGDVGKEPMIRVLGTTPKDVFRKISSICHYL